METYEKIGVIGRGAYGICYLCHAGNSRFRRKVVIKTVLIDCRTASEENAIQRKFFLTTIFKCLFTVYLKN